jgi:hypothetical protein
MPVKQTYNLAHDIPCNVAESVRQSAVRVPGATQATTTAAEIVFYTAVVASSRANNNSADIVGALAALRNLGAPGV